MRKVLPNLGQLLLLALSGLLYSNAALADFEICLKKEISNDGTTWYDANDQAEAVLISGSAHFRFTVTKCPGKAGGLYNIVLTDPMLAIEKSMENLPHSETEYPERVFTYEDLGFCDGVEGYIENVARVDSTVLNTEETRSAIDNAWGFCEEIPSGGEGCTPGYWKQEQHFDSWPVDLSTTFYQVFGRSIDIRIKRQGTINEPTLLEALNATGGQVNMAARHAVAAYLNASSSGVSFDLTPSSVIEAFQTSFDNDNYGVLIQNLVDLNEQGCPLN